MDNKELFAQLLKEKSIRVNGYQRRSIIDCIDWYNDEREQKGQRLIDYTVKTVYSRTLYQISIA
jgi:hypothetical protein